MPFRAWVNYSLTGNLDLLAVNDWLRKVPTHLLPIGTGASLTCVFGMYSFLCYEFIDRSNSLVRKAEHL